MFNLDRENDINDKNDFLIKFLKRICEKSSLRYLNRFRVSIIFFSVLRTRKYVTREKKHWKTISST